MDNTYTATFYHNNTTTSITMSELSEKTIISIRDSFIKKEILTQNFGTDYILKTVINLADIYYIEFKMDLK